jgi:hydroxymethylpyrimidine pyrophosphatase-like HAD family hydrolase
MPAAMLCAESFYYARDAKGGYSSENPWNTYAEGCIKVLHRQVQHNIQDLIESWRQEFAPEQLYLRPDCTVFLIPDEEERPARFMKELERYVPGNGQVTRNGGWVVVLPVELGKGAVIRAYLEAVGGAANHSLAVGDHINDLSMLDGSAVAYVGCPADAEPEVVQTVRKTEGLVADLPGPAGTLQVIQWFLGKTMGKMFV